MGQVVAEMSMSLDGYVADANDGIEEVFAWFMGGDHVVESKNPDLSFEMQDDSSNEIWEEALNNTGAVLTGRRTFDLAGGWSGGHPMGVPVFVLTHNPPDGYDDAPLIFVTDGIESAVEQAKATAGEKTVGIGGASAAQQAINAGLVDALRINLVPVLLGSGVPFFAGLENAPVKLADPEVKVATGVTHLHYRLA